MSQANDKHEPAEVNRLLAGAAKVLRHARYCWLVTAAEHGGPNPRPMGRLLHDSDEDEWTIRFLTDGRSRKAADMRRANQVAILVQNDADEAFVTLFGRATLSDSESERGKRWKSAYDAYFPTATDRANAIFAAIDVERMDLWIRGVTPEPFGLRSTILQRDAGHGWRYGGLP
jgi:general stress protein 26